MSSTLRTVAQIPARIKYLLAIATVDTASDTLTADNCFGFSCAVTNIPSTTLTTATTVASSSQWDYVAGDLMKDLGRQLVIYDATTNQHLAVFRQVQLISGVGVEGVPDNYPIAYFVKVWSASGNGVGVARTSPGAQ